MAIYKPVKEFAFRLKDRNSVNDEDVKAILATHFPSLTGADFCLQTGGFVGVTIDEESLFKDKNLVKLQTLIDSDKFVRFPEVESNG